ncbi:hypothetical protein [Stenomitos frigidus]|uniref:Uncharacterized protein n=1 Tax=Stenomitos frigidus ULC18 TaxID=2107698 RepID=A0A2T1EBR1_9CYAN|nr:hypothetical protein [Stenomitos frigidus]PSB30170.1 hypothetical protein C7B82_09450 [Stenomitos frigidus ULC18]
MDLSVTEIPLLSHKIPDGVWKTVIHILSSPPAIEETSDFGLLSHRYRWLVLAEMIRQKWDSKFRVHRFRGSIKQAIELEAAFLVALLNLVSETFLLEPQYGHPALWFAKIMQEWEISPTVQALSDRKTNKTELNQKTRSQNKTLLSPLSIADNPFERPATKLLFDAAIRHAKQKDRFRTTVYTPFVKARMTVTNFAAGQKLFTKDEQSGKGKISRQGRRKKDNTQISDSETGSSKRFEKKKLNRVTSG